MKYRLKEILKYILPDIFLKWLRVYLAPNNPPFGFEAVAQAIAGWTQPLLANGRVPPWRVSWLVPE